MLKGFAPYSGTEFPAPPGKEWTLRCRHNRSASPEIVTALPKRIIIPLSVKTTRKPTSAIFGNINGGESPLRHCLTAVVNFLSCRRSLLARPPTRTSSRKYTHSSARLQNLPPCVSYIHLAHPLHVMHPAVSA